MAKKIFFGVIVLLFSTFLTVYNMDEHQLEVTPTLRLYDKLIPNDSINMAQKLVINFENKFDGLFDRGSTTLSGNTFIKYVFYLADGQDVVFTNLNNTTNIKGNLREENIKILDNLIETLK